MLGLRYFSPCYVINNYAEYKRMDQDSRETWSIVQCAEQNKDPIQAKVRPIHFLRHRQVYYKQV